jgi:hypothetical protein
MGGHVEAELHGVPFEPTFGVALGDYYSYYPEGMSIVLSTGPVNCDNVDAGVHLVQAPTHEPMSQPRPDGYFVYINLWDREIGQHVCWDEFCVFVDWTQEEDEDYSFGEDFTATASITAVDQAVVKGSITFVAEGGRGPTDVDGTFEVKRCFP